MKLDFVYLSIKLVVPEAQNKPVKPVMDGPGAATGADLGQRGLSVGAWGDPLPDRRLMEGQPWAGRPRPK